MVSGLTSTGLTLTWGSDGGTTNGYQIAYTTGSTPPTNCDSDSVVSSSVPSYSFSGLSSDTPYSFLVCSLSTAGGMSAGVSITTTTLNSPPAAPTFSLAAGTYAGTQSVTITAGTGPSIYYTTNGTTPTCSSTLYSSAVSIPTTETLQAIACESGYQPSGVASATYTILGIAHVQSTGVSTGTTATATGQTATFVSSTTAGNLIVVGVNAYNNATVTFTVTDSRGNIYYQAGGYQASSYATNGTSTRTAVFYAKNIVGGADTVTVTPSASVAFSFGVHEYSGADQVAPFDAIITGTGSSTAGSTGLVASSGTGEMVFGALGMYTATSNTTTQGTGDIARYTDNAGYAALIDEDKLGVSASSSMTDSYGTSAAWGGVAASFTPSVPHFSPPAGVYYSSQSVTLSSATSASIYYTTNGTTPTCSSTLYSGSAITVSSNETIKAVSCVNGAITSPVASASYAIGTMLHIQSTGATSGTTAVSSESAEFLSPNDGG